MELMQLLLGIARLGYRRAISERALSSLHAYTLEHGVEEVLRWVADDPGVLILPSWQFPQPPLGLWSLAYGQALSLRRVEAGMLKKHLARALQEARAHEETGRIALTSLLRGEVKWFKVGRYRAGLCQLAAPHGGVLILYLRQRKQDISPATYYAEPWSADTYQRLLGVALTTQESYDLLHLAAEVRRRIRVVEDELRQAAGLPPAGA